jgi:uncharacterized membrane protein
VITDVMLRIIATLIDWLFAVLPAWSVSLPAGVTTAVRFVLSYDAYLPVSETLLVISLTVGCIMAVQGVKWTIKVIDWVADVIP